MYMNMCMLYTLYIYIYVFIIYITYIYIHTYIPHMYRLEGTCLPIAGAFFTGLVDWGISATRDPVMGLVISMFHHMSWSMARWKTAHSIRYHPLLDDFLHEKWHIDVNIGVISARKYVKIDVSSWHYHPLCHWIFPYRVLHLFHVSCDLFPTDHIPIDVAPSPCHLHHPQVTTWLRFEPSPGPAGYVLCFSLHITTAMNHNYPLINQYLLTHF